MSDSVKYIKYNGGIEASAFKKTGGTANDILLANGTTLDTSNFCTAELAASLQQQIDGEISSWFFEGEPTTSNIPANEWTTEELKQRHEGDTYTDITTFVDNTTTPTAGQSWRWCKGNAAGDNVGWHWHKIADSDATNALNTANAVRTDFNNLLIGGRNLLRYTDQSNYLSKFSGWLGTLSLSNGWIKVTQNSGESTVVVATSKDSKSDLLIKGKEYILSFDAYLDNSASVSTLSLNFNYLMFNSGGNYNITGAATITKTPARYSIKFTYTGENTATFGAMVGASMANCPVYYVKNIKLEQGNKATAWTPAPEDIDAAINSKLSLSGGTMQGSINFWNEYNTIYGNGSGLNLSAHRNININALELHTYNILPKNETTNIGSSTSVFNNIYAQQFVKSGSSNDYVLLAGGGTKLLSEITPDLSGYLKLSGGEITGDILPHVSASPIGEPQSVINQPVSLGSTNNYFKTVYARLFKGLADNALKLYTYSNNGNLVLLTPSAISLGNLNQPVYFEDGVPVICNSIENVKQLNTNATGEYPLLCKFDTTSNPVTNSVNFASGVTLNPQSQTITTSKLNITNIGDAGSNFYLNVSKPVTNKSLVIGSVSNGTINLYINRSGIQAWDSTSDTPLDSGIPSMYLQGAGGNVICGGEVQAKAFYETSDIRKKEIKYDLSLSKCYNLIDKCQTVIYSLKDLTKEQVGMIAQEIEEFFPEVVATDEEGFKSLAYDRLVVICFKVLKDVIKRLEKLES